MHTILRLSTANWRRFFSRLLDHGHNPEGIKQACGHGDGVMTTKRSTVLFQALMSKSWNAVFWLWAIRARRRGPLGAEARSGFETVVERVAEGHKRVGQVK
ncbi:MAG: hypothetical protein DME21_03590 [Verrucomicrobia bacterium]|nr:MAG: hypothetical protein DME21_03590 [Verrucomicrobiota bacterium]